MSGFVALWNTDGTPIDEALLIKMENFLSSRGPDEQRHAILGANRNVGLAHAAFYTASESHLERQPCTVYGDAWLAGDIRIDAREQLWKELGADPSKKHLPTDAEMALRAYHRWGPKLVERLIGDYSFVIWDAKTEQIHAVRDHLGVRPLFYARAGQCWICSNSLECVRLHPEIGDELDDIWISNFLAVHFKVEFERTAYRQIKRLPPAYILELSRCGKTKKKYWEFDVGEPIYYKKREQYHEHFRELAKTVIGDRIRIERVGSEMSGGLDSTTMVAFIREILGKGANNIVVQTNYSETLIYDDEPRYATAAADHIGIPITLENTDEMFYDPQWWQKGLMPPEPHEVVLNHSVWIDAIKRGPLNDVRVLFVGHGADEALNYADFRPYLLWLLNTGRLTRLGSALYSTLRARGLGDALRKIGTALTPRMTPPPVQEYPPWVRSKVLDDCSNSGAPHPWRPHTVAHLRHPVCQGVFESFDPGIGGWLVEAVYPYLDVRMMQFLSSVPVVPWCHRKALIRESMTGMLPESVLRREKTYLSAVPSNRARERHPFPPILQSPELSRYVDMSKIPAEWPTGLMPSRMILRLLALQHWLSARQQQ
ncbi:hypothetical protein IYY11_04325 [Methylocystis sp. H62]|uniref:asparagine synthetase B family protein n=1 Tax=Methylocystis sp. H62 TaxID=2785789 RepID=UPI0018C3335A|nr:asparagine synthase-related protein [Methylocystis sp. H62]MBG0792653.1 hypothetical protein [Methylocystis sp. H62]